MSSLARGLRTWWPDLLVTGCVFVAGMHVRLRVLPYALVSDDSIGPYLTAHGMGMGGGWLPEPHAVPFGPGLYWTHALLLAGASSLQDAFWRRAVFQALMAVVLYVALRRVLGPDTPRQSAVTVAVQSAWPARLAAAVAAMALCCSHGLALSLQSSFEMYWAPDLLAWVTAAALLVLLGGGDRWLLAAMALIPLAIMVHPFSVAYLPGLLALTALVWWRGHRVVVVASVALAGIGILPRLVQMQQIKAVDDQTGLAAVTQDVQGTAFADESALVVLVRHTLDAFTHREPPPLGPALLVAPLVFAVLLALLWRGRARWLPSGSLPPDGQPVGLWLLAGWTAVNGVSLLVTGYLIGYLQSYHWRGLMSVLAVQLGLVVYLAAVVAAGWLGPRVPAGVRWGGIVACAVAVLALVALPARREAAEWPAAPPGSGDLAAHAWVARVIQHDAHFEPRWFDQVFLGEEAWRWGSSSALFLEQQMQHVPVDAFQPDGLLYLVVSGSGEIVETLRRRMEWRDWSLAAWDEGNAIGARSGEPVPARGFDGVALVGMSPGSLTPAHMVIRLEDPEAAQAWTGWLCTQFEPGTVNAKLDANDFLSRVLGKHRFQDTRRWYDDCVFAVAEDPL